MKRLVLATFFVFILLSSCVNYFAARDIMHNYPARRTPIAIGVQTSSLLTERSELDGVKQRFAYGELAKVRLGSDRARYRLINCVKISNKYVTLVAA